MPSLSLREVEERSSVEPMDKETEVRSICLEVEGLGRKRVCWEVAVIMVVVGRESSGNRVEVAKTCRNLWIERGEIFREDR